MAISRERRTALAELMVAGARMQTAKAALKEDPDTSEAEAAIGVLLQSVVDSVERAMGVLKS